MRMNLQIGLLATAGMLFVAGCGKTHAEGKSRPAAPTSAPSGTAQDAIVIQFVKNPDVAPAFQLNDLEGKPLSLGEARGKIVLLNFWATWCGPCRAEIPDLVELQQRYADKLEILALATAEDDADEVRRFVLASG